MNTATIPIRPSKTTPRSRESRFNLRETLTRARAHLRGAGGESTLALMAAVDARDPYTRVHSLSVAVHSEAIARRMGLAGAMISSVRLAALLHDVGKIGMPDAILAKPGPLSEKEFALVRRHPQVALEILAHLSFLTEELALILHHHERFDGRGYPSGLSGERIPLGARILAVSDSLDTMLSPRPYKPAYTLDHVRSELIEQSGRQFDPRVAAAALGWLDEIDETQIGGPRSLAL